MKSMKKKMPAKAQKGMAGGKSVHDMMGMHKMCDGAEKSMPRKAMKG